MDRDTWLGLLRRHRAIAILRAAQWQQGIEMAQAAARGGFCLIEVTWTSDRPAELVHHLRQTLPNHCRVGVGTILTLTEMKRAIAAGAQFCFTPHTDESLLRLGQAEEMPVVPGALSPTEIMNAWQLGAWGVKVFPSQCLGGAAYIRHLQGPLAHIPLIPTGGVTLENGRLYLEQGAIAIGLSSSLFPAELVQRGDWQTLEQRSQTFLQSLRDLPQQTRSTPLGSSPQSAP